MITIKAGYKVGSFRRCILTSLDPAVVLSNGEILEKSKSSSVLRSHSTADIPKHRLVKNIYRIGRLNFKVNRELVTQTSLLKSSDNNAVLLQKVMHYLSLNQIHLLLEEIDSLLLNSPALVNQIPDLNLVFIKSRQFLHLKESPVYSKEEQKNRLSVLTKRLVKLYSHLANEHSLNSVIVENLVETLVANNKGIKALHILQEYPACNSTINLVNLQIKIAGDGNPETWIFPTGQTLKRDRNLLIRDSDRLGSYDCMKLLSSSGLPPNLNTIHNLILVIGKSKNLKLLTQIVNDTWGLEKGTHLPKKSLLYPNLDTLINLVYCYAYNNEFLSGLKIMSEFMKAYKFSLKNDFWYQLFNVLSISMHKSEEKFEYSNSLWKFMKSVNGKPGWNIYSIRLSILKEFNNLSQIIETIPEIYSLFRKSNSFYYRLNLKQYMSLALKLQSQKNLRNQSVKLVESWSPDNEFRTMMDGILYKYYTDYNKRMDEVMSKRGIDTTLVDIDEDDDDDGFPSI